MTASTPTTGARCACRPGDSRDNCPRCEGTGMVIDFAALRAAARSAIPMDRCWYYLHTTGGVRRCTVKPDGHEGPHKYEEVPS